MAFNFLVKQCMLALVFLCLVMSEEDEGEYPVVSTKSGRIRGKILKLGDGRRVAAFLGISFAEPPVGGLRFKAPVPRAPWNDIFDATEFGSLCFQKKREHCDIETLPDGEKEMKFLNLNNYSLSEDCLNLNIYVPAEALLENSKNEESLSVMFFIHGGSYKTNGGRLYPGEILASHGQVITVTVNYRLGVLGFLSTADSSAKGNYGLLDQILALQWIKENIGEFGGDPADITIFGNSAGGACVGLHLMSPMSKGLFTKAIIQSGSPIGEWAVQRNPRKYVKTLAENLNCSDVESSEAILQCLRAINVELILEMSENSAGLQESLTLQFAPTVDGEFLLARPTTLLQQEGSLNAVPVIIGVTRDEFEDWMERSQGTTLVVPQVPVRNCQNKARSKTTLGDSDFNNELLLHLETFYCELHGAGILSSKDNLETTHSSFLLTKDYLRDVLLHLVRKDHLSDLATNVLVHAVYTEYVYRLETTSAHHKKRRKQQQMSNGTAPYVENSSSALPNVRTLAKIISDVDLKAPSVKLANMLSLHSSITVYLYEFDYASKDDMFFNDDKGVNKSWVGSYHGSELYYIFGLPHMNLTNALRRDEDKEVANVMIQLWSDFAKTGNPTPRKSDEITALHNFTWPPYTEEEEYFATLGLQPFVARSYEPERMSFWNHFIPLFTEYPILTSSKQSKGLNHSSSAECATNEILQEQSHHFAERLMKYVEELVECLSKEIVLVFFAIVFFFICLIQCLYCCLCSSIKGSNVGKRFPIPV